MLSSRIATRYVAHRICILFERDAIALARSRAFHVAPSYNPFEDSPISRSPSSVKQMAALGSVGSAVVLVGLKVFLAVATGSLGVLSEALHSGLDLIAAILTWLSVRVSDRPADSKHTYGHGKIENFSAFVETGLLLATAVYIICRSISSPAVQASASAAEPAGHS